MLHLKFTIANVDLFRCTLVVDMAPCIFPINFCATMSIASTFFQKRAINNQFIEIFNILQ
jgi:hypothetical protein